MTPLDACLFTYLPQHPPTYLHIPNVTTNNEHFDNASIAQIKCEYCNATSLVFHLPTHVEFKFQNLNIFMC